ncbi:MAG TPA: hypothetical protein PLF76_06110 [Methanomassiliicoccaceae archaeon]|nr:hypothetical protein [Methanomassiliicoccaceae archaeon]
MVNKKYLFIGPKCPKCKIVMEWLKDNPVDDLIIKDISMPDNLALAAYLEVGMEIPVLFDVGHIIKSPEKIIQRLEGMI